jgi:polar amino acid transport system permease protein
VTAVREEPGREGAAGRGGGSADGYAPSRRRIERERHRRARGRRATAIASLSTLVTGAVLGLVVVSAPGWARTRETFFDGRYAREALP